MMMQINTMLQEFIDSNSKLSEVDDNNQNQTIPLTKVNSSTDIMIPMIPYNVSFVSVKSVPSVPSMESFPSVESNSPEQSFESTTHDESSLSTVLIDSNEDEYEIKFYHDDD